MLNAWQEELVNNNLTLVYKIARQVQKYTSQPIEYEELVSMGTIGLYDAVSKYDPKRGIKFTTFAYYRVKGSMLDGLRRTGWKTYRKTELHLKEAANDYLSVKSEEKSSLNKGDMFKKLATGIAGLVAIHQISLQEEDNPIQLTDAKAEKDFEKIETKDSFNYIFNYVNELTDKEKAVINAFYFEGISLKEFAERYGKTKSWASRFHAAVIDKLRKKITTDL